MNGTTMQTMPNTSATGSHRNRQASTLPAAWQGERSNIHRQIGSQISTMPAAKTIMPILQANIVKEATVCTDGAAQYNGVRKNFAAHDFTVHSEGEYMRGDVQTHTI